MAKPPPAAPDAAPDLLTRVLAATTAVLAGLNHQAVEAARAGRPDLAVEAMRKAVVLTEAAAQLEADRNRILAAGSLQGPIRALAQLAHEADAARAQLASITQALASATRLLGIIGQVLALLP